MALQVGKIPSLVSYHTKMTSKSVIKNRFFGSACKKSACPLSLHRGGSSSSQAPAGEPPPCSGNSRTNSYQVVVPAIPARAITYDAIGNLLSDGIRTYEWDALNRAIKITWRVLKNSQSFLRRNVKRKDASEHKS